jgi:hypothetical protein
MRLLRSHVAAKSGGTTALFVPGEQRFLFVREAGKGGL